jgi:hypothetical protein
MRTRGGCGERAFDSLGEALKKMRNHKNIEKQSEHV